VSRFELLVPVSTGSMTREVMLAFGPRLSEEPYSTEDLELLATIAAGLALVERGDAPANVSTEVAAAKVVRPIRSRYRIERLIGRGGMGTVWQAHDDVLDRQGAIKFLTSVVGPDPHPRFQREPQT